MGLNTITVSTPTASGQGSFTVTAPVARFTGAVCSPPNACPSSVQAWLQMHSTVFGGQNNANKQFYSGTQKMSTWQTGHLPTDNESQLPPGALKVITYKDAQIPSLAGYVRSIPADQEVWMVYFQEAENDYPNGDYATFIKTTIQCSDTIRAVGNPNVKVVQDSAGSKYGVKGSTAQQGLWVVPPEHIDIYAVDCYQNAAAGGWPTQGLANFTEFQTWLSVYAKLGRPLAITEYGLDACQGDAARNARLMLDHAYLQTAFGGGPKAVSPFPLQAWIYWYSNCTAGQLATDCQHQHQFTDAASVATWTSVCAGTL